MTLKINEKIVGYSLVKDDDIPDPPQTEAEQNSQNELDHIDEVKTLNIDPRDKVIDKAPEGLCDTLRIGMSYLLNGNKRKMFVHLGFLETPGFYEGEKRIYGRAVEAFARDGADSIVEALMISISREMRGGLSIARIVKSLINQPGGTDTIFVKKPEGLPEGVKNGMPKMGIASVPALIGWLMRAILEKRGLLDIDGADVPYYKQPHYVDGCYINAGTKVLMERSAEMEVTETKSTDIEASSEEKSSFDMDHSIGAASVVMAHGPCPDCGEPLQLLDGCKTCVTGCGWSKCQ